MKSVASLPSLCLTTLLTFPALAAGAVIQTNWGTGDGTLPGLSPIVAANNLLHTSLASASRTGEGVANPDNLYFYGEDNSNSIPVVLGRLYDGQFGAHRQRLGLSQSGEPHLRLQPGRESGRL